VRLVLVDQEQQRLRLDLVIVHQMLLVIEVVEAEADIIHLVVQVEMVVLEK
jgi:hypothetical protein